MAAIQDLIIRGSWVTRFEYRQREFHHVGVNDIHCKYECTTTKMFVYDASNNDVCKKMSLSITD